MRVRTRFLALALLLSLLSPGSRPARAQAVGQAADALAAQGRELLSDGKLPEAAAAYTSLLERYPNSGTVPEALFYLAYIQNALGEYPQAIATLRRIVSPPASPEIKAAADALLPQVLIAQASKLAPADYRRRQAFQAAINAFTDFIRKNPRSPQLESAVYGRAIASYQIQDFPSTEKDLANNIRNFPNSPSILEDENLLATVLIADANAILAGHGNSADALAKLKNAIQYLAAVITSRSDALLANSAQYQIGEVLFAQANAAEGAERDSHLQHAIQAYQAVIPRDLLAQQEQATLDFLTRQRQQALAQRDSATAQRIQAALDRGTARLAALKQGPDQSLLAQLRVAGCYVMLKQFDEARVLIDYLQPFATDDSQKKQIAYYLILSYASQGVTDKAEAAFNAFQSRYRSDPIAENLPLAIGTAYLTGAHKDPGKAIAYFQQEINLYPRSPLVPQALAQEAGALISLKQYQQALAAYNKFLASKPPPEQAVQAEQGIAVIYQRTGRPADSVRQYQKVADTYPGTPQAEQSGFYAAAIEVSLDPKKAADQLQAYLKKYPAGQFAAQATMIIAQLQASSGNIDAAMATYKSVADKFPDSEYAPQAYFQQAALLGAQKKTGPMLQILRDFIAKFPDNKDIFFAYDTIGSTQVAKHLIPDAIKTYAEMADKHSDNPNAPTAIFRQADLWQKQAAALGLWAGMNPAQRQQWSTDISNSIAAAESLIGKYPDSRQVGLGLKTLLADQTMLLDAKQTTSPGIDSYFNGLADKFASHPAARSRILFTLATYTYQQDPARALADMAKAYDPSLVYAPDDLDIYGQALIDQGRTQDALAIYQKIARDFPIPPGVAPSQAPVAVQEAQAAALFGMASALDKQGKTADAGRLFTQLKATYPWSPKVLEANFGIARALVLQGRGQEAMRLLLGLVASKSAPAPLRARSFLLVGDIQSKTNIPAAIDSYLKTAALFEGVKDAAAEGLWKGGQMLEQQAAGLTEQSNPKKSDQIAKAVAAYKSIVSDYSSSPYLKQAQDRLAALGAK